jgi:hypothetical protein
VCPITISGLEAADVIVAGANVTYTKDTTSATTTPIVDWIIKSDDAGSYSTGSLPSLLELKPKGGETIKIVGRGFSDNATKEKNVVMIDGVQCVVTASTVTSIDCTTAYRGTISANLFTVHVDGKGYAVNTNDEAIQPKYWNLWSDYDSWSGEFPPGNGDSILIPKGQSIIWDVGYLEDSDLENDHRIKINAIFLEGTLKF